MERGVVFSGCELLKTENGDGFRLGKWISSLELNYLSLYWDRLVSPTNNMIHVSFEKEDELIRCGLLTRPNFERHAIFNAEDMTNFYAETHAKTIDILRNLKDRVDWRMHFLNDQINLKPELSRESEVIRFELARLLPVPPESVDLHDILEFKERRKPELMALHGYLDELYFEIIRSGDISLQRAKALYKLEKAISDLERLNHEGWRSPIRFSISTSFEFDLTQAFGSLAGVALALNGPHPYDIVGGLGTVVSILGGCIKISPHLQSVLATGDHNLAYISKGKNEGIFL